MREKQTDWGATRVSGPGGLDQIFGKPIPDEAHVSLYLPTVAGDSMIDVRRQLIELTLQAERLLSKTWLKEDLDDLLQPVFERIKHVRLAPGVRGIALFRRFDFFKVTTLRTPPPRLSVVANSFHVKPLLHCRATPLDCMLLRVTKDAVKLEQVSWLGSSELAVFPRDRHIPAARDLRSIARRISSRFETVGKYIAMVGSSRQQMAIMEAFGGQMGAKFFSVDRNDVREIGLQEAVSIALLFYIGKDNTSRFDSVVRFVANDRLVTSLQEIARAVSKGEVKTLFVDAHLQLWGKCNPDTDVTTYPWQQDDEDDCVVDDLVEAVLRQGGNVEFFDHTLSQSKLKFAAVLQS